ncbi:MAG: hypothetical protein Kow00102_12490 [Spirochaetota bacterium]
MKKIILTAIIITALFSILIAQEDTIRVSIAPFDNTLADQQLSLSATSMLTQSLSNNTKMVLRKPEAIQNYINLLEKVQLGIEDPNLLKGKGNALQIDYLMVGTIGKIADRYELDARLVDINTWQIVSAYGVQASSFNTGIENIAANLSLLNKKSITQYQEASKEKPTAGIHEFREYYENPPHALYCATFMEMLTSALANKTSTPIIENKFTSRLLEEKSFEMTGIIENSKADQIFAIQGIVNRIIGDIRVFPDMITVNYKVVNTNSQSIIFTGSIDVVNPTALRAISAHVAKIIDDALNNKIGNLTINTTPVDAEIYIDDTFAGTTKNKRLMVVLQRGTHTITAKANGFKAFTCQSNFEPRKTTEIIIKLERITERYLQEAFVFESQGKFDRAVEKYEQFVKETGNTQEANVALYRMGHILLNNLKDYNKAKDVFTSLLNNYPEAFIRAEGYFGLAQTYLAMGNKEQAKSTINYLLEYYPESNAAIEAKAIIKTFELK